MHLFTRTDPIEAQIATAVDRQGELLASLRSDLSDMEHSIKELVGRLHADAWKAAQARHEDVVGTQRLLHGDTTTADELRHEHAVESFQLIRESLAALTASTDRLQAAMQQVRDDVGANSRHLSALVATFRADTWRSHRLLYEMLDDRLARAERTGAGADGPDTDGTAVELPAAWTQDIGPAPSPAEAAHRTTGHGTRAFSGYDGSAARWFTQQPEWWTEHYIEAVDQVRDFLAGDGLSLDGKAVLDIGCGDGIISLGLANRLGPASLVGIDVQAVDTDYLGSLADEHGVDGAPAGLTFTTSSPRKIPADDASFDFAVSWSVFEHVEDPRALLHEVRRVLKPTGFLMIQLWPFFASEHGSHLWAWFDQAFVQWRLSEEEVAARLADACPTEALAASMLDLFRSCNRITLDDLQRDLVAEGFYIGRVEPMTSTIHLPSELQSVPLSQLAITGVKLLAAPR